MVKQFAVSSGSEKLFSSKSNAQFKMYKMVSVVILAQHQEHSEFLPEGPPSWPEPFLALCTCSGWLILPWLLAGEEAPVWAGLHCPATATRGLQLWILAYLPPPPPANMARDAASSDSSFRSLYEIEPEAEGQGQRVEGRPCHVSSHASSDHLSSVQ